MLMGPRARMVGLAAMLPPGMERTGRPSMLMSAGLDFAKCTLMTQSGHPQTHTFRGDFGALFLWEQQ